MNTQPKMSIEEENTQRVIGRAVRLGYIIVSIRSTVMTLVCR